MDTNSRAWYGRKAPTMSFSDESYRSIIAAGNLVPPAGGEEFRFSVKLCVVLGMALLMVVGFLYGFRGPHG